ncbi:MAG: Maf family protein [Candidatus Eremiobacterota bacterium]
MKRIILASNSPRRQELLKLLGINFEIQVSSWKEMALSNLSPRELCCHNAREKAKAILLSPEEDCIVIGCDTIVVLRNHILEKPETEEDARKMLSLLSGKAHIVYSGLSVRDNKIQKEITEYVKTTVKFRELSSMEIDSYISTGEPFDKAGAYGIQGKGALFVEYINGCYYNVVGLPLVTLYKILLKTGINIWG